MTDFDWKEAEARFWAKVEIKGPDDCWIYRGPGDRKGYGIFYFKSGKWQAHRFAWIVTRGEILRGLFVCHKCDTPRCCNPSHFFSGTNQDNMTDMVIKGRSHDCGNSARLTVEKVREVRELFASGQVSQRSLAKKFQVAQNTIKEIVHRRTWKWVE